LCRRGLTTSFFVVAGRLGSPGFLDAEGVRTLAAAGMTIGCHGMRHRGWRRLDEHALREELVDAKQLLEDVVQRPVNEAACPFGSYDRRVLGSLRRFEYGRVYTSDRGTARFDDWIQCRNTVHTGDETGLVDHVRSLERSPYHTLRRRVRVAAKRWR
jgi:peptidoglycan/xylan/chitin deacetylase (PgdA/CDA1 family)